MLKIDKEYVLRQIGDDYIIVPVGQAALSFNGMITVNETGAFLWEQLVEGTNKEEMLRTLMESYEVAQEEASRDIDEFLEVLHTNNIL
jgi:sensor domain CHASE-containing protein